MNTHVRDQLNVLVSLRNVHDFGGSIQSFTSSTGYVALPDSSILQINAGDFGSGRTAYLEVTGQSQNSATANFRLYQTTAASAVTGSSVALALTTAFSKDRARSCGFTVTGSKLYEVQIEGTIGATGRVAGLARVYTQEVV